MLLGALRNDVFGVLNKEPAGKFKSVLVCRLLRYCEVVRGSLEYEVAVSEDRDLFAVMSDSSDLHVC